MMPTTSASPGPVHEGARDQRNTGRRPEPLGLALDDVPTGQGGLVQKIPRRSETPPPAGGSTGGQRSVRVRRHAVPVVQAEADVLDPRDLDRVEQMPQEGLERRRALAGEEQRIARMPITPPSRRSAGAARR